MRNGWMEGADMSSVEKWLQRSLLEMKHHFLELEHPVPVGLLEALDADSRRGAQALARKIREKREKEQAEKKRLKGLLKFEEELWAQGYLNIAGVDEAGVAPLAGPVVAGAVILPHGYRLRGLDDSKKILDEKKREELARQLKQDALCWGIGQADVEEIDTLNVYHAGLLAMRRAVEALGLKPDYVLVDARTIPECPAPQRGIIRGDALSLSIAAASVLAKTTRDAQMVEWEARYPGYGFSEHKGYPTPKHFARLKALGATPLHRRSFNPVREVLGLLPSQAELFPGASKPPRKRARGEETP